MMSQSLRCTYCGEAFRWRKGDWDSAICPHCDSPFDASTMIASARRVSDRDIPTVHVSGSLPNDETPSPRSALIGLALLPLAIPMIWLIAPLFSGKEAVFTYATPVSLALCATGLSLGIVLSADWSFQTRLKAILAITCLAYGLAIFLYFLKPEWVASIRRNMGGAPNEWQLFTPDDGAYSAKLPGRPRPDPSDLITGWSLRSYRYSDRRNHSDIFIVAHGSVPAALRGLGDEEFFEKAGKDAAAAVEGTLTNQIRPERGGYPQRRYVITLADKATTRTVMVIRAGEQAFVAAVEGAFLPPDAKDVGKFFQHFAPKPKRP